MDKDEKPQLRTKEQADKYDFSSLEDEAEIAFKKTP